MQTIASQISDYLTCFKEKREVAFFGLIEMGPEALPELISAFRNEHDSEIREFLIEVIWQHRQPSTVPFLGEALYHCDPAVWKQALDGLVTLASPQALEVLKTAKARQFSQQRDMEEFQCWLDEAIEQAESEIHSKYPA